MSLTTTTMRTLLLTDAVLLRMYNSPFLWQRPDLVMPLQSLHLTWRHQRLPVLQLHQLDGNRLLRRVLAL